MRVIDIGRLRILGDRPGSDVGLETPYDPDARLDSGPRVAGSYRTFCCARSDFKKPNKSPHDPYARAGMVLISLKVN